MRFYFELLFSLKNNRCIKGNTNRKCALLISTTYNVIKEYYRQIVIPFLFFGPIEIKQP
jgi:hypothetical protein